MTNEKNVAVLQEQNGELVRVGWATPDNNGVRSIALDAEYKGKISYNGLVYGDDLPAAPVEDAPDVELAAEPVEDAADAELAAEPVDNAPDADDEVVWEGDVEDEDYSRADEGWDDESDDNNEDSDQP